MDKTLLAAIAELTNVIAVIADRRSALEAELFPVGARLDLMVAPYAVVVEGHCSYDRTINLREADGNGSWEYWWDIPRLIESLAPIA